MERKLLIRDLTLRDGQQSAFATRMTQAQVDRVLPHYKRANFFAMEVWGGAVPDSIMRYLKENPWTRLETIKREIGAASKLTALSRGRNLFGYNPYPDTVIEGFCRNAVRSGISIMRIFDALNDIDNMTSSIKFVKENGGQADCAVCYTVDPQFTWRERLSALLRGKILPFRVFPIDYFVEKALALEKAGADLITIKDMAGLIDPAASAGLIRSLKKELKVPVNLHTHCTPGFGLASVLMAMVSGVDIVDTVIMNFAGGPAAPAYELVQVFADRLGLETGVDRGAVASINAELKAIRQELSAFDEYREHHPIDFDAGSGADNLPPGVSSLFDRAIAFARENDANGLLGACHGIDQHFNFPPPDDAVRLAQIPGGMYTNMMSQMKAAKMEHLFDRVLKIVPKVRIDAGCPPLVTPTSQIVGVQAVSCVLDEIKGKPMYTTTSSNFVNLVRGSYGKTPIPVDPEFRLKIAGTREETPYDTSQYKKQPNPLLPEFGNVPLAGNEKEELLIELFPSVAENFLKSLREKEYKETPAGPGPRIEEAVAVEPEEPDIWDDLASRM